MAERRAFKTDESFLEKIAIGATGTKFIFDDLTRQGHEPIELERGSMSFKIWKAIKIKRVRVPDILCVRCGTRVESRAKTKLEISMSHSKTQPERGWDAGLIDQDKVAFVVCGRSGTHPIDWLAEPPAQYIAVPAMRSAVVADQVKATTPKGATEGFEVRYTWPVALASAPGFVSEVSEERLQWKRESDDRTMTVRFKRKAGLVLAPQVREGEVVIQNQILASVVPVSLDFSCPGLQDPVAHFEKLLESSNLSDRYSAVKGLAAKVSDRERLEPLRRRLRDQREHIYVRLEAASTLLRFEDPEALSFVEDALEDEFLPHRLEAVIILGELKTEHSRDLLIRTLLNEKQNSEIRAGAAWSLGETSDPESLGALVKSIAGTELNIRVEAARALAKIANASQTNVLDAFGSESEDHRPGIAWALSHAKSLKLGSLLPNLKDLDTRQWGAWILGTRPREEFISEIERLREHDPEVYFTATVLWKVMASWVYGLEEY